MRKKTIIKLILIPLGVLGLVAALFASYILLLSWTWTSGDIPHKSDEELIANFQAHRSEFNQLLEMISQDKGLQRVDDNWTRPENPQTIGISQERIDAYRKLFGSAGVPRGFYAFHDEGVFEFIASAQGLAVSGSSKGYIYSTNPLTRVVANLDNYHLLENKPYGYPIYRHIEGNWYLFFDAD
ncbi:MAG TPA: hypothetical protein VE732_04725 [Nitrososphaera sp.]|jgi:hypothetical protein|nr:hypothetical protein [Nitrososphaera sp.]